MENEVMFRCHEAASVCGYIMALRCCDVWPRLFFLCVDDTIHIQHLGLQTYMKFAFGSIKERRTTVR